MGRRAPLLLLAAITGWAAASCRGSLECTPGEEACECADDGTCLGDLECMSGICFDPNDETSESEGGDGDGDGSESAEASSESGDGDGDGDGDTTGDGDGDTTGDGDGDTTGDGDGDGDGDACAAECTPGGQECGDGNHCVFTQCGDGGDFDTTVCDPIAGGAPGITQNSACTPATTWGVDDPCGVGLQCLDELFGVSGICAGLCGNDGDCSSSDESCMELGEAGGLCARNCTWDGGECSGDGACVPVAEAGEWFCLPDAGLLNGQDCAEVNDCVDGLACLDEGGSPFCQRVCDTADGDLGCFVGQSCVASSELIENGLGGCQPSGTGFEILVDAKLPDFLRVDFSGTSASCGDTCTVGYLAGQQVELQAVSNHPAFVFDSWQGAACAGQGATCQFTAVADETVVPVFVQTANIAFVSVGLDDGLFGGSGTTGADDLCASEAADANLPGSFKAMLSSNNQLDTAWDTSINGAYRIDGLPWFDQWLSVVNAGEVFYPMEIGANGQPVTNSPLEVWVGGLGGNCQGWTQNGAGAETGRLNSTSTQFQGGNLFSCGTQSAHVYCMSTGNNTSVEPPAPGNGDRIAFLTDASYPSGGGVSAFDTACQAEADDAGIGGSRTYRAYVRGTGSDGSGPFTPLGPDGWFRPDGTKIAQSDGDWFVGNYLSGISQTPTGVYSAAHTSGGFQFAWTGNQSANTDDHCADFTSNSAGTGYVGLAGGQASFQVLDHPEACSTSHRLYCLEQ